MRTIKRNVVQLDDGEDLIIELPGGIILTIHAINVSREEPRLATIELQDSQYREPTLIDVMMVEVGDFAIRETRVWPPEESRIRLATNEPGAPDTDFRAPGYEECLKIRPVIPTNVTR